ncbi:MAG: DNA polymerase III subunit gamma/tau [Cyanobacteria bacterium P01_A01_bin.114]
MDYEPLHHKYRPQTFGQLVGQGAIATTLSNALRQNRIAPAYLFCGPRGTGKTSSARILAKSLNCLSSSAPTPEPCGQCQVCQEIASGAALDIVEIDAASNTGVDNIRELIERAQFAPVQCRYKLYVLDEVHMLSTAAFNALLKTLEEPPARVVFVLATTDPQRVLPTIISRCQRFDFRRIPLDEMVRHLNVIAEAETIPVTADALQLVAQISQGGLRDAESLLDQLGLLDGEVTVERVWDLVGAVPERDLLALVQAIATDNGSLLLEQARRLMDRGREPLIVLQSLVGFYRDLLIAKTASQRQDLVAVTPPTWAEMIRFAETLPVPLLLASQQHLRSAEVQVKNTTQPRLWLEITLMGLLPSALGVASDPSAAAVLPTARPAANPVVAPAQSATTPSTPPPASSKTAPSKTAPSKTTSQTASTSSPTAAPHQPARPAPETSPSPPAANQTADDAPKEPTALPQPAIGSIKDIWAQIIANLQPFGTQALMRQQCQLIDFDGVEARVGIRSKPLLRMAQDRLSNVETAFEKVFGHKVKVSLIVMAADEPPEASAVSPASPPSSGGDGHAHPAQPQGSQPPEHQSPGNPPPGKPVQNSVPAPSASPPSPAFPPSPASPPSSPSQHPTAPPPDPSASWSIDSEFDRSVKSFAQFFNGQIVNLDEEADTSPQSLEKAKPPSQPGPDVPF